MSGHVRDVHWASLLWDEIRVGLGSRMSDVTRKDRREVERKLTVDVSIPSPFPPPPFFLFDLEDIEIKIDPGFVRLCFLHETLQLAGQSRDLQRLKHD